MQRDTVLVPVPDISNICLDLRALFDYRVTFLNDPWGPLKIYQDPRNNHQFTGKQNRGCPSSTSPHLVTLTVRGHDGFFEDLPCNLSGVMVFKRSVDTHLTDETKILEVFVAVRQYNHTFPRTSLPF